MRTHVVAGGAGFIGSTVVDRLVRAGERVVVVDDLSTGRLANLEHAIGRGDAAFVFGDLVHETAAVAERVRRIARGDGVLYVAMHPVESAAYLGMLLGYESVAVAPGEATRVLEVGDPFGPRMRADGGSPIAAIFAALAHGRPAPTDADVGRTLHVTWIDDVARTLVDLGKTRERARYVCPGTDLTAAQLADAVGAAGDSAAAGGTGDAQVHAMLRDTYRWFVGAAESAA